MLIDLVKFKTQKHKNTKTHFKMCFSIGQFLVDTKL